MKGLRKVFAKVSPIVFQAGNQLVSKWFIPLPYVGTNWAIPLVMIRAIAWDPLGLWVFHGILVYDWVPIGI